MIPERLPHNQEAERAVIGAALLDSDAMLIAVEKLKPCQLYFESHQLIWQKCIDMEEAGKPVDEITLTKDLRADGNLERVGGASYLSSLIDDIPDVANVGHYADIVADCALKRSLIATAIKLLHSCQGETESGTDALEGAQQALQEISETAVPKTFLPISLAVDRRVELLDAGIDTGGIQTGLHDLDRLITGLRPGDYVLIGARPSVGKTAIALNIACNMAIKMGQRVALFSLEQTSDGIADRVLASIARIDITRIISGKLDKQDFARLPGATEQIRQARIMVDDSSGLTVLQMKSKLKRLMRDSGCDIVFIDYAQLIDQRGKSENEKGMAISLAMANMAKELSIPVVLLCQLNRESDRRGKTTRPRMSDIRGSGGYEADADIIWLLWNPDQYKGGDHSVRELVVAKNRQGSQGVVPLVFDGQHVRFESMAHDLVDNRSNSW